MTTRTVDRKSTVPSTVRSVRKTLDRRGHSDTGNWRATMDAFEYSDEFKHLVVCLHRGMEKWPYYESYLRDHLGGPQSRVVKFANYFCREVEYHCGSMSSMRVLDFGCGTGASTVALAQYAKEVCAFDIDQESIEICKMRVREHGLGSKVAFFTSRRHRRAERLHRRL